MFNPLGRGPKYGRKCATFSAFFLENEMNPLSALTARSEFINIR